MKRKYIKLNDGYSFLSLGNIVNVIKEESKNKSSAIQSQIFCAIFDVDDVNDSTVNNYCIGSRSIGDNYKQKYIILNKRYENDNKVFLDIINNILSIVQGRICNYESIDIINNLECLKLICKKIYNIAKNDSYVSKEYISSFRDYYTNNGYYDLFVNFLIYAILERKQPFYEDEKVKNTVELFLENTDISVNDLQSFLELEMNGGNNFDFCLKKLADEGNSYANYELGKKEYRGLIDGKPNYDKAFEYFKKATEKNHPSAYWMMGNMIKNGYFGNNQYDKSIEYFLKARNLGSVAAINSLGLMYLNGLGVKKDLNQALILFNEAANKGYAYAYNNLANYYKGKNEDKVLEYFIKSAELGESYACKELGIIYLNKNDYINAYKYFNKSLDSSIKERNVWSYYYLAKYFYLCGSLDNGIVKNVDKAIEYFNLSSVLIDSLCELLYIYYEIDDFDMVNYYKDKIEKHEAFNDDHKKVILNVLGRIKNKIRFDK